MLAIIALAVALGALALWWWLDAPTSVDELKVRLHHRWPDRFRW